MANLDEIKTKIMELVKDDHYSWDDLKQILTPISIYVDNPSFRQNVNQIIKVMTKDRDGNNIFTIDDLKLLSKDVIGITTLTTAILLLMAGIPEMKLEYSPEETEEIVFKLLAYLFLVIIPKETGNHWTLEEKEAVIDLSLLIYSLIKSSQVVEQSIAKIQAWFQKRGLCKCLCGEVDKAQVVDDHLPAVQTELTAVMDNIHEKQDLLNKVAELETQVRSLRNLTDAGKEEASV